jgi:hypothetical protein
MTMPTYDEWISGTAKSMHSRGSQLKELDAALKVYVGDKKTAADRSTANLRTLEAKLNQWKSYNQNRDWTASIRERKGMVSQLEAAIQEAKGKVGLVSALGQGPFVPKQIASMAASEARRREDAFDQNTTHCQVPTHQRLVYPSGAQDFNWTAKFELTLRRKQLDVTVRIKPKAANAIADGGFKNTWKTHIQSGWTGAKFKHGTDIYDVKFVLTFVDDAYVGDVYTVDVAHVPPPPQAATWREAEQRRTETVVGQNVGTPHMGQWGATDAAVINHEFGHMLGLPDEYYTTEWNHQPIDGSVYNQDPFTTDSIMNNTGKEGRIFVRHYDTVKRQFELWQGFQLNSVEVILKG